MTLPQGSPRHSKVWLLFIKIAHIFTTQQKLTELFKTKKYLIYVPGMRLQIENDFQCNVLVEGSYNRIIKNCIVADCLPNPSLDWTALQ